MKLIVGLGNPGKDYKYTRHNMGFMAIDFYASKNNLDFKKKFNGLYSELTINGEKVILVKPQTYMNLSGECVREFVNYFHIDLKDILIIHDDKDFDVVLISIFFRFIFSFWDLFLSFNESSLLHKLCISSSFLCVVLSNITASFSHLAFS